MKIVYTIRPAIAMIELIFAIVVMGIVLMSAPQLIQTATQSGYVAIQQEAINEASSHINNVLSYPWDENLPYPPIDGADKTAYLLHATGGHADLNKSGLRTRRGSPIQSVRHFIASDGNEFNASTSLGFDSGESSKGDEDDLDDFDGSSYNLTTIETSSDMDYIEKEGDITIVTEVLYLGDSPSATDYQANNITYNMPTATTTPTNIKQIKVTLTSNSGIDELNKTIELRAFSCNIGEAKPSQFVQKVF